MRRKIFVFFILPFLVLFLAYISYSYFFRYKNGKQFIKQKEFFSVNIVASNLDTPWSIAFLPNGSMLVTERNGTVRLDNKILTKIKNAVEIGEGGLLGAEVDPYFKNNYFVYFYYTYREKGVDLKNRVVQMKLVDGRLLDEKVLVDKIPGAVFHNGGRIKFGPDGNLYITTGDAGNPNLAQDKSSLAGKILQLDRNNKLTIFSYGHRNSQGLAWDDKGRFFATEHGRSGLLSGLDEVNLIVSGKNYGWPLIQGDEQKEGLEKPLIHSGEETWAPAGMAYFEGKLYFGGLRGQALYQLSFVNGRPKIKEYFKGKFGRIRDVVIGPDKMLYFSTSNRDGRGKPKDNDDKIIRVNPKFLD